MRKHGQTKLTRWLLTERQVGGHLVITAFVYKGTAIGFLGITTTHISVICLHSEPSVSFGL